MRVQSVAITAGVATLAVSAGCSGEDLNREPPATTGGADTGGRASTGGRSTGGRVGSGGVGGQGEGGDGGTELDCAALSAEYGAAVDEVASCDPASDHCSQEITLGLECTCPTFVNGERTSAIDRIAEIRDSYVANGCSRPVLCGMCVAPDSGYCAADGRCRDLGENARGCKVAGEIYADGESGVPDPTSCNTCTCQNGELSCTEINCPSPCPDGEALGTQCGVCGPTDACLVVEHGCFPTCTDDCDEMDAFCHQGLCLTNICG